MHMTFASRALRIGCLAALLMIPRWSEAKEASRGGSAFFKSLLIPGWGQMSLGHKNSALTFFGSELVMVGGMFALNSYGSAARDDYQSLAAAYAGVVGEHNHDFYVDVGNWMTVDQYNEQRLRDRSYAALYTTAADHWSWDSEEHRSEMERARIRSDRAFNSVFYLVGGLAINHIASAIHAGRLGTEKEKKETSVLSPQRWHVGVHPTVVDPGFRISLTHSF
jgi:hypothetical protein